MKKLSIILLLLIHGLMVASQTTFTKYWVAFTDKNNSPYTLSHPENFLSQKALDRRTQQGIALKDNDLPVSPAYIDSLKAAGFIVINRSKWLNGVVVQTSDTNLSQVLSQYSFVKNYSPVEKFHNKTSKEKFVEQQQKIAYNPFPKNDYGPSYNQLKMLNGQILHRLGYTGNGITIAILDAGFVNADTLMVFDRLWQNGQIKGWHDFVDGDNNVFDHHTHGTEVLSTMGGYLPGRLIGTAPDADFWLLRTEDGASELIVEEYNWVSGAEFADSVGADIINSSLGYTTFDQPAMNHTYADMDGNTAPATIGADIAASKGILVVNSAGNSGNSPWHYIGVPADGDSVLAVGAVDSLGNRASFSSVGPSFDGRVKPDVDAQGYLSVVADPYGNDVIRGSGTSFSSPIMAGMAACLWQAGRSHTNIEVLRAIQKSASQYQDPDSLLGYGIPNFQNAYFLLTIKNPHLLDPHLLPVAYPNPFHLKTSVMLYSNNRTNLTVRIYDVTGKNISTRQLDLNDQSYYRHEISALQGFPPGCYILKLNSDDGKIDKAIKLLKN